MVGVIGQKIAIPNSLEWKLDGCSCGMMNILNDFIQHEKIYFLQIFEKTLFSSSGNAKWDRGREWERMRGRGEGEDEEGMVREGRN